MIETEKVSRLAPTAAVSALPVRENPLDAGLELMALPSVFIVDFEYQYDRRESKQITF